MRSGALIVEADGGSRGNPGVAGYGALVRDAETGALLAERAEPLGKESNNVAEYRGLIAGLEAAAEIDPAARVSVRMDSKLVIEQMAGRWKIKHPGMRELASRAQELVRDRLAAGGEVSWTWIPREQNKDADRLSNDGMDGKTVRRDPWRTEDASGSSGGEIDTGVVQEDPGPAPDTDPPARVIFVRHAVTDFTMQRRLDGRGGADPALNADGHDQARRLADAVADIVTGPVTVITSSLRRGTETGAPVAEALGVEPRVDDGWDEQAFGEWDGLSLSQIRQAAPDGLTRMRSEPDYAPRQGESHRALETRVQQAYHRAVAEAGPGGTVVVVTHRRPIMVVLGGLLGLDMQRAWVLAADPASVSEVKVWRDRHVVLSLLNQTAHLHR